MKSVNKTTVLNICSTVLLQGISLFTIPVFTKILGADQYGAYSVFNSWVSILTCVMGAGVGSSLGTGWYEFKDKYYSFRSSILLLGTVISAIIMVMIGIFIKPLSVYFGYSYGLIFILLISALGHFVVSFVQGACIYEKKAELNFAVSTILSLSTVALSLILIPRFDAESRFLGRVYGTAIPYTIAAMIMWVLIFIKKPSGLHKNYCRYGLRIGVPIIFHMLSQNILSQSDRVMMQKFNISNSEIGIYSLFYTLVAVTSTILSALNNSWCPFYYDDLDSKDWKKLKHKCRNFIELFTVLIVGFLLLSREVSYLLADSEYWEGINVIPILAVSVFFTFMYQFPVNFEFFYRKTQIIAIGTVGAAIINIILNAIMIPGWGMYGAAMATMLSYGILFIAHYIIVTHMKEEKYHLKAVEFMPAIVIICITTVLFYWLKEYWLLRWLLGIAIGIYELRKMIKRKTVF